MNQDEMNVDEINAGESDNLKKLRERIAAKQTLFDSAPPLAQKRELMDVPQVSEPRENGEFSLDRHAELAFKTDTLFNNYLVHLETLGIAQDGFENALRDLCRSQTELLQESLKPRF